MKRPSAFQLALLGAGAVLTRTSHGFAPSSSSLSAARQFAVASGQGSSAIHLSSSTAKSSDSSNTGTTKAVKKNNKNHNNNNNSNVAPFQQPPRVIRAELPVLYVYDHCPFCVRVRLALGIKNVKHSVVFMANDDIPIPTKLVGKKIAPIFSIPEDDFIMMESLDIIAKVDGDDRFGETDQILPVTGRTDIKEWQKSVQTLLRALQRPRYVATGLLPEFQQLDGRLAFIKNHQLPPYEKKEWRGEPHSEENPGMPMDEKLQLYAEAMAKDPVSMLEILNSKLVELNDIMYSEYYCSDGGLSLDDIDLWSRLRSITIVKGVNWPEKLRAYMDNLSALGDVPLYDDMAL